MIIYTCPKCGEPLTSFIVAVYPPIDVSECRKCGWRYESKPDSVKYIPFPWETDTPIGEIIEKIQEEDK